MQKAAVIAEFTGTIGNASAFTDFSDVSPWAVQAFNWNIGSELIFGSSGKINPKNNITCAETAALVLRLLQNSKLIEVR